MSDVLFARSTTRPRSARRESDRKALDGLQIIGGYGYATEYDMEHHVRRSVVTMIYAARAGSQREIIGRAYGL